MHPYVRTGLMTLGVVGAIALFVLGVSTSRTGGTYTKPNDVVGVEPIPDSLVTPQADVFVHLIDTDTGVLQIDGHEIPEDQIQHVDPLGELSFSPGIGKEIERFGAGTHSVTVVYWPKVRSREAAKAFTWRFRVG